MNYLTLENVTKSYGDKVLFQDIGLTINKGDKIALVAKNGTGKTTLMNVLSGDEAVEGETSKILFMKGIKIGFLKQDPILNGEHTVIEAVFSSDNEKIIAFKEYQEALLFPDQVGRMEKAMVKMDDLKAWDMEARINEILYKFKLNDLETKVKRLSGGQQKRIALAKMLIDEPDFLILDEPTNHLDIDMIEWLESILSGPNITLFMVTHDRYFLERVCDNIIELDKGQLYKYRGSYTAFLEKKAVRETNDSIEAEKDKKLLKKELSWVSRQPKARGTKAKSRVDAYKALKSKTEQVTTSGSLKMEIQGQRLGSKILEIYDIYKAYDSLKIVESFSFKFKKGEKVGIVGPNGVGKTTFLKMLTGVERPDRGKVIIGETVKFGYFTQDGIQINEDKRVIDVIRDIAEYIPVNKGQKITAAALLERFLFDRKHQQVYAHKLSGGEKRRLHLLTILMENPNFLILDEPTNDLDILSLNVLEEFLAEFQGCVIIVSHDRYFMDKIVDHLFVFEGQGKIRDFNGHYSEYRALQELQLEEKRQQSSKVKQESTKVQTEDALSYEERKKMKNLENSISKLEQKKELLNQKYLEELSQEEMIKVGQEIKGIENDIEEKEMEWMLLAEKSEA